MLIDITDKCSLECKHCLSSCTKDGQHMSEQTFRDVITFLIKNELCDCIIISGGEPTEHPEFVQFLHRLTARLKAEDVRSFITITTNGFWCLENPELAKSVVVDTDKIKVVWQVSTDTRYYPKDLPVHKKLWREPGFVLCEHCVEQIYPQGRALENDIPWKAKASKCFNIRALSKQLANPTVTSVVKRLIDFKKFCTPRININGGISLGESRLCPTVATIYDDPEVIIKKIQEFQCHGCDHVNEQLSPLYKQFVE